MSFLPSRMLEPFQLLECVTVPDGQGGEVEKFEPVSDFAGVIISKRFTVVSEAFKPTLINKVRLYTPDSVALPFRSVVRRVGDNKTFRLLSDNKDSDSSRFYSRIGLRWAEAEECELW